MSEIPIRAAPVAAMGALTAKSVAAPCEGTPPRVLRHFVDGCHRSLVSGMMEEDGEMKTNFFLHLFQVVTYDSYVRTKII